jgi:hypothetical protein
MTESCSACFTKTGKPKKLRYTYAGEARHHALIASLRADIDLMRFDVNTQLYAVAQERDELKREWSKQYNTAVKMEKDRDELGELVSNGLDWFINHPVESWATGWMRRAESALQRGKV